jgi:hypothetical protein
MLADNGTSPLLLRNPNFNQQRSLRTVPNEVKKRDCPSPEASPVLKSRLRNDYSRMNVSMRLRNWKFHERAMAPLHWG